MALEQSKGHAVDGRNIRPALANLNQRLAVAAAVECPVINTGLRERVMRQRYPRR